MGRRRRDGEGFGFWGPFPSYSRRTRGGGSVRVSGCCLPLTLALLSPAVAGTAVAVRTVARAARR